jgi:hypothetical protein
MKVPMIPASPRNDATRATPNMRRNTGANGESADQGSA